MDCFIKSIVFSALLIALLTSAVPARAGDKPDVVVLVNPATPRWVDLLKEGQALGPIRVVMTEHRRGVQAPANVRIEVGTSLARVKDWRYGFVLGTLSQQPVRRNDLPPKWWPYALDYSLYFNPDNKGAKLVLKHTIFGQLGNAKGADQFIRTLFPNTIGPDLSASLGPKIYALGKGTLMASPITRAPDLVFPVRLAKGPDGDLVEFPLDNRLDFPVNVRLEVGPLGKNFAGVTTWRGDRTVNISAHNNPFTLKPGEKRTISIDLEEMKGVAAEGVVPKVSIFDPELAEVVK
jgi:hypothetical protein